MSDAIIVWDLETVPDIHAAARVLRMSGASEPEIREAMGIAFQNIRCTK